MKICQVLLRASGSIMALWPGLLLRLLSRFGSLVCSWWVNKSIILFIFFFAFDGHLIDNRFEVVTA